MAKQIQLTTKDLAIVQVFLCEALAEPGSRLTTADIFQKTKDEVISNLDSHHFRASLSERIKDGTLGGLIIKKGRYGGVSIENLAEARNSAKLLHEKAENAPDELLEEEDPNKVVHAGVAARAEQKANALIIHLGKKLRIYPLDKFNWAIQKCSGTNADGESNWISQSYYSTLDRALYGAAKGMLDKRFRGSAETVYDLKDLEMVVLCAREDILNELKASIKVIDES